MFSKAVPIAAGFTRPVVISSRSAQGECAGTIGAYVVLNREGWILTAGHLLDIVRAQQDSARRYAGYRGNVVEFHRDIAADKRHRKKGVRTFHQPAGASGAQPLGVVGGGRRAPGRGPGGARGRPRARAPRAVRSRLRRALPGMEGPFAGLRAGAEPVQARLPPAPHRAGLRREGEHVHLARGLGAATALSHGRDVHPAWSTPGRRGAGTASRAPSSRPRRRASSDRWAARSSMRMPWCGGSSRTLCTMRSASARRCRAGRRARSSTSSSTTGLAVHAAVIRRFLDAEGIAYRSEE